MKQSVKISLVSAAFVAATAFAVPTSASACNPNGNCDHNKFAPAPLLGVGAGLPILAIGGAYWLVRRYRRKSDAA
jgi:hypothetical protein